MATQSRNIGHASKDVKYRKEEYEQFWAIPDWVRVQQNIDLIKAQTFSFQTGKSTLVKTKWEIGFQKNPSGSSIGIYWKLVEVTGFQDKKLQTTISTSFLYPADSRVCHNEAIEKTFEVNQIHLCSNWLSFGCSASAWASYLNSKGEIMFKLNLKIIEPEAPAAEMIIQEFHKSSIGNICANLATVLNDTTTADLKILTSDGKELMAHKVILRAQCPVFDSMFRSKMSENQTGVVDVRDVSEKTMTIFLHYFYSGELLPTWKDEDTIVEFTYTAGKYQITHILELLDKVLGTRDDSDATQIDVLLIDLATKLGLKNAEMQLLDRIIDKTNKVKSGEELLSLYGLGK